MNAPIAAIAVAITILLGVLADGAREPRQAPQVATEAWECTLSVEDAIAMTERVPPECIAPPEIVADVLIDMGISEPEPSKPIAAQQCICLVSCLRAGGCAPGVWDGL